MLPKPLKVYLDTSIFNFAISIQDVPYEKEHTVKLLDHIRKGTFLGYVSDLVIGEIQKTHSWDIRRLKFARHWR